MGPLAQVGLALATSIGAWINLALVLWFAHRTGHLRVDQRLRDSALRLALAGVVLAAVLGLGHGPASRWLAGLGDLGDLGTLAVLGALGALLYAALVWLFFGRAWLTAFRAGRKG
jgi:putative peptidoglycan lipid II flippase